MRKGKFNADEILIRDTKNFDIEKFVKDLSANFTNCKVGDTISIN